MSNASSGTGILFKAGDGGAPEVFTAVVELVALKPPQISRNEIDVSNHNEGTDAKLLGMLRKGQVTGTCNWIPTDPTQSDTGNGMLADILVNKKRNWRIELPAPLTTKWTFPARVQLFDPQEVGVDGALQFAFAMTIDGAIAIS
jgi:hypothetical protein